LLHIAEIIPRRQVVELFAQRVFRPNSSERLEFFAPSFFSGLLSISGSHIYSVYRTFAIMASQKIVGLVARESRRDSEPIYDIELIGENDHDVIGTRKALSGPKVADLCIKHRLQIPTQISDKHYPEMNFWENRARQTAARWTPTVENNKDCRNVTKEIYTTLQQYYHADRIYKSGSYSKGTQLRGRNELDFLVWVDPAKDWTWTKKCQLSHLKRISAALWTARRDGRIKFWDFQFKGWVISFMTKFRSAIVSVDICVTSEAPSAAEYSEMSEMSRRVARTSFTIKSLEKIKSMPSIYKDTIRLLKLWRRHVWDFESKFPSYLFELLVYAEYRKERKNDSAGHLFRECIKKLANMIPGGRQRMFYISNDDFTLHEAKEQWRHDHSNIPIVPDIGCIDNNVAKIGNNPKELWARVSALAQQTLKRLKNLDRVMASGGTADLFETWRSEYDSKQYHAQVRH
jgi:hypothetical protein